MGYFVKHRRLIENIQRHATKLILNYPPREVSYINRLDQLNLLPLDFRRQMHDLHVVLLFKYRTGTVTSNFGCFIQTATWHLRKHLAFIRIIHDHQPLGTFMFKTRDWKCKGVLSLDFGVRLWNEIPCHMRVL